MKSYRSREFAQRAGVTVRALHRYNQLGLPKPGRRGRAGFRLYGIVIQEDADWTSQYYSKEAEPNSTRYATSDRHSCRST